MAHFGRTTEQPARGGGTGRRAPPRAAVDRRASTGSAGNAHYAGKREQERLVAAGPVPWTIVPATQFHDFAAMVASWTESDGVATIAPLLVQPIAPADVAEVLAEVAVGEPQGRYADVAGPDTAGPRRHGPPHLRRPRSHGQARAHLVGGLFGAEMAGNGAAARRGRPDRADHVRRLAGYGVVGVDQPAQSPVETSSVLVRPSTALSATWSAVSA